MELVSNRSRVRLSVIDSFSNESESFQWKALDESLWKVWKWKFLVFQIQTMNGHFHKRLESKEIQRSNVPNNGQMMTKMKVTEKLFIENEVIKRE